MFLPFYAVLIFFLRFLAIFAVLALPVVSSVSGLQARLAQEERPPAAHGLKVSKAPTKKKRLIRRESDRLGKGGFWARLFRQDPNPPRPPAPQNGDGPNNPGGGGNNGGGDGQPGPGRNNSDGNNPNGGNGPNNPGDGGGNNPRPPMPPAPPEPNNGGGNNSGGGNQPGPGGHRPGDGVNPGGGTFPGLGVPTNPAWQFQRPLNPGGGGNQTGPIGPGRRNNAGQLIPIPTPQNNAGGDGQPGLIVPGLNNPGDGNNPQPLVQPQPQRMSFSPGGNAWRQPLVQPHPQPTQVIPWGNAQRQPLVQPQRIVGPGIPLPSPNPNSTLANRVGLNGVTTPTAPVIPALPAPGADSARMPRRVTPGQNTNVLPARPTPAPATPAVDNSAMLPNQTTQDGMSGEDSDSEPDTSRPTSSTNQSAVSSGQSSIVSKTPVVPSATPQDLARRERGRRRAELLQDINAADPADNAVTVGRKRKRGNDAIGDLPQSKREGLNVPGARKAGSPGAGKQRVRGVRKTSLLNFWTNWLARKDRPQPTPASPARGNAQPQPTAQRQPVVSSGGVVPNTKLVLPNTSGAGPNGGVTPVFPDPAHQPQSGVVAPKVPNPTPGQNANVMPRPATVTPAKTPNPDALALVSVAPGTGTTVGDNAATSATPGGEIVLAGDRSVVGHGGSSAGNPVFAIDLQTLQQINDRLKDPNASLDAATKSIVSNILNATRNGQVARVNVAGKNVTITPQQVKQLLKVKGPSKGGALPSGSAVADGKASGKNQSFADQIKSKVKEREQRLAANKVAADLAKKVLRDAGTEAAARKQISKDAAAAAANKRNERLAEQERLQAIEADSKKLVADAMASASANLEQMHQGRSQNRPRSNSAPSHLPASQVFKQAAGWQVFRIPPTHRRTGVRPKSAPPTPVSDASTLSSSENAESPSLAEQTFSPVSDGFARSVSRSASPTPAVVAPKTPAGASPTGTPPLTRGSGISAAISPDASPQSSAASSLHPTPSAVVTDIMISFADHEAPSPAALPQPFPVPEMPVGASTPPAAARADSSSVTGKPQDAYSPEASDDEGTSDDGRDSGSSFASTQAASREIVSSNGPKARRKLNFGDSSTPKNTHNNPNPNGNLGISRPLVPNLNGSFTADSHDSPPATLQRRGVKRLDTPLGPRPGQITGVQSPGVDPTGSSRPIFTLLEEGSLFPGSPSATSSPMLRRRSTLPGGTTGNNSGQSSRASLPGSPSPQVGDLAQQQAAALAQTQNVVSARVPAVQGGVDAAAVAARLTEAQRLAATQARSASAGNMNGSFALAQDSANNSINVPPALPGGRSASENQSLNTTGDRLDLAAISNPASRPGTANAPETDTSSAASPTGSNFTNVPLDSNANSQISLPEGGPTASRFGSSVIAQISEPSSQVGSGSTPSELGMIPPGAESSPNNSMLLDAADAAADGPASPGDNATAAAAAQAGPGERPQIAETAFDQDGSRLVNKTPSPEDRRNAFQKFFGIGKPKAKSKQPGSGPKGKKGQSATQGQPAAVAQPASPPSSPPVRRQASSDGNAPESSNRSMLEDAAADAGEGERSPENGSTVSVKSAGVSQKRQNAGSAMGSNFVADVALVQSQRRSSTNSPGTPISPAGAVHALGTPQGADSSSLPSSKKGSWAKRFIKDSIGLAKDGAKRFIGIVSPGTKPTDEYKRPLLTRGGSPNVSAANSPLPGEEETSFGPPSASDVANALNAAAAANESVPGTPLPLSREAVYRVLRHKPLRPKSVPPQSGSSVLSPSTPQRSTSAPLPETKPETESGPNRLWGAREPGTGGPNAMMADLGLPRPVKPTVVKPLSVRKTPVSDSSGMRALGAAYPKPQKVDAEGVSVGDTVRGRATKGRGIVLGTQRGSFLRSKDAQAKRQAVFQKDEDRRKLNQQMIAVGKKFTKAQMDSAVRRSVTEALRSQRVRSNWQRLGKKAIAASSGSGVKLGVKTGDEVRFNEIRAEMDRGSAAGGSSAVAGPVRAGAEKGVAKNSPAQSARARRNWRRIIGKVILKNRQRRFAAQDSMDSNPGYDGRGQSDSGYY